MIKYKIIKEYSSSRYPKKSRRLVVLTPYGLVDVGKAAFKKSSFNPSIRSAINKGEYFQNKIDDIFGKGKIKNLSSYTHSRKQILVKSMYGIHKVIASSLLDGCFPSIQSNLDKRQHVIILATKVHGNKYDYSKVVYKVIDLPIIIICKIHGEFKQTLHGHLKGHNCPLCAAQEHTRNRMTYIYGKENILLYVLKMKEENGIIFYKIGITKHSVKYRYIDKCGRSMIYKYKIISEIVLPAKRAINLEKELHFSLGKYHYVPERWFGGSKTECYKINQNILNNVIQTKLKIEHELYTKNI